MKGFGNIGRNECQFVTFVMFYCRDSAEINGCGSLQTSSWLGSFVLRNPPERKARKRQSLVKAEARV